MRLGLDIGTNSIGWWLYETHDGVVTSVVDGGVRIFSDGRDPKSKASLAVDRRAARAQRRRRDRYLRRKAALMKHMAAVGLMPADPAQAKALEALDPYALRAEGLDHPLPLTHFGRALFHLNQRRGFKSNRKTDRGDNESGKIKDATARLDQAMMARGARTYGEFLHMRRTDAPDPRQVPGVRTRLSVARRDHDGKEEAGYDFYPDRRHLSEEFDRLWGAQSAHAPDVLTDALRDEVSTIIFHQRPLKAPEVGLCLFTDEKRIPSAHPLNQRRILMETVNNLKIAARGEPARPLRRDERDRIVHALDNKAHTKSLSGMSMKLRALGKVIKLRPDQSFTLETANRDAIACDPVRASLSHPDRFGARWSTLDAAAQWDVITRIRAVQSDAEFEDLVDWLVDTHAVGRDNARATANAPLPEGYGRLGLTATTRILSALEVDVIPYSRAVADCGWHHSDRRTGAVFDPRRWMNDPDEKLKDWEWPLPYYGEVLTSHVIPGSHERARHDPRTQPSEYFGRITNPTVHIGLNQLRRLVNRIIRVYNMPDDIVVELARDLKMSEDQKRDVQRDIRKNTDAAIMRGEKIRELGHPDNGANRARYKLWEDLGPAIGPRRCPYTGETISAGMIFDGSCDVDHILPYSRTLDDGFSNRTLCLKEANRQKADRTPWETWGETDQWNAIAANLKNLPANKAWRFAPDAMERFEGENDFSARALKDTQYLSRIARAYLDALYDGQDGKSHVWVVPGRLTEMLRRHWGLNGLTELADSHMQTAKAKNRTDHRHHAIDAAVVAATDRGLVKRIADMARRDEVNGAEEVARSVPPPWDGFRADIGAQIARIIVSHRADHGRIDPATRRSGHDSTSGALHEATAVSIIDDTQVAVRIPLSSITPAHLEVGGRSGWIRDPQLRQALAVATGNTQGKAFEVALADFTAKDGPYRGLRRVRIVKQMHSEARVEVPAQNPIKAYLGGSNHRYEVWRLPDDRVVHHVVSTFTAHQGDITRPHPAAKRLHKLMKGDLVRLEDSKFGPVIAKVEKFSGKGTIELVPHNEANASDRYRKSKEDLYIRLRAKGLIKAKARRVFIDEMGRIRDPGPAA